MPLLNDYYTLQWGELGFAKPLQSNQRNIAGKMMLTRGRLDLPEPFRWRLETGPLGVDWIECGLAVLLSERLRGVLETNLGPEDEIQWIASEVEHGDGTVAPYWSAHFPHLRDVLDEERTDRGPSGVPMRWCLSRAKLTGIRVTAVPMSGSMLVVDEEVVRQMMTHGIVGVRYSRAPIAD